MERREGSPEVAQGLGEAHPKGEGKPKVYLATSVLSVLMLATIPATLSKSEPSLTVWEASLYAMLPVVVVIQDSLSYQGQRGPEVRLGL